MEMLGQAGIHNAAQIQIAARDLTIVNGFEDSSNFIQTVYGNNPTFLRNAQQAAEQTAVENWTITDFFANTSVSSIALAQAGGPCSRRSQLPAEILEERGTLRAGAFVRLRPRDQ